MLTKRFQILFLIILVTTLNLSIFSQTSQCDLSVSLFDVETSQSINNVEIKLIDFETKEQKSINKDFETPVFSSLDSGNYQIELNKKGYKKKVKKFFVDCSFADNSNRIFENIHLQVGDNSEVIRFDSTKVEGVFKIGSSDSDKNEQTDFKLQDTTGSVNNKAISLVAPIYPPAAKAIGASGQVKIQVTLDEDGNVIQAEAIEGHPLLRAVSVKAARQSKFLPTLLNKYPVKITGLIVHNFKTQ